MMNIIQKDNKITIHDIRDFNITHIFECGHFEGTRIWCYNTRRKR